MGEIESSVLYPRLTILRYATLFSLNSPGGPLGTGKDNLTIHIITQTIRSHRLLDLMRGSSNIRRNHSSFSTPLYQQNKNLENIMENYPVAINLQHI